MARGLIAVAVALVVVWTAFVAVIFVARPKDLSTRDGLRLLPDVVRLVRALAADRDIPLRIRGLVWLLLAYLLSPIDFVPDFVPVVGLADDVVVTIVVLRFVLRRAGADKLGEHWPGSPEGLATVRRLARI